MFDLNCNINPHMHCCQNCNALTCIHGHKRHWLVYHYLRYFPKHLSRSHNLHHQDCICRYCTYRHKPHRPNWAHFILSRTNIRSLPDHTLNMDSFIKYHSSYHLQPSLTVILMLRILTSSHCTAQSCLQKQIQIPIWIAQFRIINRESCTPDHKSHLLENSLRSSYFNIRTSGNSLVQWLICTRGTSKSKMAFQETFLMAIKMFPSNLEKE